MNNHHAALWSASLPPTDKRPYREKISGYQSLYNNCINWIVSRCLKVCSWKTYHIWPQLDTTESGFYNWKGVIKAWIEGKVGNSVERTFWAGHFTIFNGYLKKWSHRVLLNKGWFRSLQILFQSLIRGVGFLIFHSFFFRTPDQISVSEFLSETTEDYNSPTTSSFTTRLQSCKNTVNVLEVRPCRKRLNGNEMSTGNKHINSTISYVNVMQLHLQLVHTRLLKLNEIGPNSLSNCFNTAFILLYLKGRLC